ncbi:putative MATE efflux family protein [Hibiscus syriacus]|uniref:MATE efflux family protein n=1 Tax=Hibiscus syriacus TaxID=106335 RepID=A0A6A2XZX3_HIBSY|nr:putative MATE efflux family protein [Hibiscus syriacus]
MGKVRHRSVEQDASPEDNRTRFKELEAIPSLKEGAETITRDQKRMDEEQVQKSEGRIWGMITRAVLVKEVKKVSSMAVTIAAMTVTVPSAGRIIDDVGIFKRFRNSMWASLWIFNLRSSNLSPDMPGLDFHGQTISSNRPRSSNCNGSLQICKMAHTSIAWEIVDWLNVILLGIYMRYSSSCEKTRILVPEDVFASIKELFRFGIPSAVMLCFTTATLHFYIPFGISAAASTRVSNELGAGNPQAAQLASLVVMSLTVVESVVASTIIFCCRYVFGYAFSNDKEVIDGVIKMVPLMCLSIIMDSYHAVLAGVVIGIGWQHIGAYINAGAYYLAGIPTGILCAFVFKLRGKGLWLGMLTGSTVDGILFTFVTVFTNWKKQAMIAKERIFEGTRSS